MTRQDQLPAYMQRRVYVRRRDLALAEWRHAWDYGTDHQKDEALTKASIASARLRAYDAVALQHPGLHRSRFEDVVRLIETAADRIVGDDRRTLANCYRMNG